MSSSPDAITIVMPRWLLTIERWLHEARRVLHTHPGDVRPVAVEQAAAALGVQIVTAPLSPTLWGLSWGAERVLVNSDLAVPERRFALAHELAHVGQARGFLADDHRGGEQIADWFAQELLLPLHELAAWPHLREHGSNPRVLKAIADTWQVPAATARAQAGWLPYDPAIRPIERTPSRGGCTREIGHDCSCASRSVCIRPQHEHLPAPTLTSAARMRLDRDSVRVRSNERTWALESAEQ